MVYKHSMLTRPLTPVRLGWLIAAIAFVLDQLSKWFLLQAVDFGARSITVAPFFDLVMVWNRGVSFGMFAGDSARWPLIALAVVIVALLARWLARNPSRLATVAIGMVIGGALANVLDRLRFGAVADFFYFHIGPYGWPAFNIADSAICMGVALLCLESMLPRKSGPTP